MNSFESASFAHIYREINGEAYLLSNMALALQLGVIEVEEFKNGQVKKYFTLI